MPMRRSPDEVVHSGEVEDPTRRIYREISAGRYYQKGNLNVGPNRPATSDSVGPSSSYRA
nr:unnamed protein product [Digitaria exilis]